MSALGQKQTFRPLVPMSALTLKADIRERDCLCVPKTRFCNIMTVEAAEDRR
jgi:hypothetical protein